MSDLNPNNLSLNDLYKATRRAVIFYFAKEFSKEDSFKPEDFEAVMLFVTKCYQAYYKSLEDAQKGDINL